MDIQMVMSSEEFGAEDFNHGSVKATRERPTRTIDSRRVAFRATRGASLRDWRESFTNVS